MKHLQPITADELTSQEMFYGRVTSGRVAKLVPLVKLMEVPECAPLPASIRQGIALLPF